MANVFFFPILEVKMYIMILDRLEKYEKITELLEGPLGKPTVCGIQCPVLSGTLITVWSTSYVAPPVLLRESYFWPRRTREITD